MSNLSIRYDWNNPKEISDKKLYSEFYKESIPNKILIFRLMNKSRRANLRILWNKEKKKQEIKSFLEYTQFVLAPLKGYLDIKDTLKESDIKNTYELWLIMGIAQGIGLFPLTTDNAVNIPKDEKKFIKTKQSMINFLNQFKEREWGMFADYNKDPLIEELKAVEYKKPPTKKEWELQERENNLNMMHEVGIGKERAKKIIISLERWSKNAPTNRYGMFHFDYKLNPKHEELLGNLKMIIEWNNHDFISLASKNHDFNQEEVLNSLFEKVKAYGINEKNYQEAYSNLMKEKEKHRNKVILAGQQADEYYSLISNRILNK